MAPPQHCTNQNREPCSKILLKYLSEIAGGYYYNIILGTYLYIYICLQAKKTKRNSRFDDNCMLGDNKYDNTHYT